LQISSEELVSAYIKRIEEVNPIINAVVENRFSEAITEAKNVDEYLSRYNTATFDLEKTKPLLGVPITIKECLAVKGMSYTGCSLTRKGIKAKEDAEAVKLLKEAGAIVLLVSSTPEYCTTIETYNNVIGRTKNPYDTRRACGGSSGGEGALLGAGASIIGIGSDICGSIRVPCAFNGIYGHKPSTGIVPLEGSFPWCDDKRFSEYLVIGPLTRYVEDLKLTLKVLAGSKALRLRLDEQVNFETINLFYMVDSFDEFCLTKVDRRIKHAIEQAVLYLSKNFKCKVHETKFPEMAYSNEMCALIFTIGSFCNVFTDSEIKYNVLMEFLKFLRGHSIFSFQSFLFNVLMKTNCLMTVDELKLYSGKAADFKEKFTSTLGTNGVFLYPSFPTEAFRHNGFIKGILGTRFAGMFNLFGCPCTCVPIGLTKNGLPLGIQVVGAPNQDNLTLEVAKELGKYFGGWEAPN
ncbi:amidase, partial [Oryctes borbonicus]